MRARNPCRKNPKLLHHRAHYQGGMLAMEQDRAYLRMPYKTTGIELIKGGPVFITMIPTGAGDDATVYVQSILHPSTPPVRVALSALIPMPGLKGWPRGARQTRPNPSRRKAPAAARAAAPRQVRVARRELNAAVELFHKFREAPPRRVRLARFKVPKVCVVIGEMDFVGYTTSHAKKRARYRHDFSRAARPLLCASSDGRQLLIFGGNYDFTRDGIVDRA